jgi:hypothetical protein
MMRVCSFSRSLGVLAALAVFALDVACGEVLVPREDDDPASDDPSSSNKGSEAPNTPPEGAADPGAPGNSPGNGLPPPPPPPGPRSPTIPLHDRMVFVTSVAFASQDLQGVLGADQKCNDAAKASGNKNIFEGRQYIAWIADDMSLPPLSRIVVRHVRYVRPDGEVVANSFSELQQQGPAVAIEIDEMGQRRSGIVWSGTNVQGIRAAGTPTCMNWSRATGVGNKGRIVSSMPEWTDDDGFADCYDTKARLYCFEK